MRFREHRGSLSDSLATTVELEPTMSALADHVYKCLELDRGFVMQIKPYMAEPDDRIGWPATFIVTVHGVGVAGFTDQAVD